MGSDRTKREVIFLQCLNSVEASVELHTMIRTARFPQLFALREWQLTLPLALFLGLFYLAPLLLMAVVSVSQEGVSGISFASYAQFFRDPVNLKILFDTVWMGTQVTILCLVVGYPLAYVYSRANPLWQKVLTFVILLPLLTSAVVRTFAWIVILGREGIVNSVLLGLGLVENPIRLLFTHQGVVIALAQVQLPMMVLPLVSSMTRIDLNLEYASASLGAGAWRTFWKIALPLSLPGITAGCMLTYALSVSSFVTPSIIGGSSVLYIPTFIYQQAMVLINWPFAAAISIILLVTVLTIVTAFNSLDRVSRRYQG